MQCQEQQFTAADLDVDAVKAEAAEQEQEEKELHKIAQPTQPFCEHGEKLPCRRPRPKRRPDHDALVSSAIPLWPSAFGRDLKLNV